MSMVVFKIIVQKTVDKVLGSLKPHHILNSQVKINRYIKLSQNKLTNVVMGRRFTITSLVNLLRDNSI